MDDEPAARGDWPERCRDGAFGARQPAPPPSGRARRVAWKAGADMPARRRRRQETRGYCRDVRCVSKGRSVEQNTRNSSHRATGRWRDRDRIGAALGRLALAAAV